MSSRNLFPHFFDPRQGFDARRLMLLAKLHLLLFEEVTVQDNFFISRLFADLRDPAAKTSPFCEWIERGWAKVALRDGAYSLSDLKGQLYQKTLDGEYIPFEEKEQGLRLYRSRGFARYLKQIDGCLATPSAILTWNADELGRHLRIEMKRSAENGSSGLPQDDAVAIWKEVDRTTVDGTHSRSLYSNFANKLPDSARRQAVLRWVGFEYLKNLPRALGLGVSLPRSALRDYGPLDPLVEPLRDVADAESVRGRDCVLFSSWFLETLGTRDIERLRSFDEFKTLAGARYAGKPVAVRKALLGYLRALGEEAPRIVDPSIRSLEAQVRFKRWLGPVAFLVGVILQLSPGSANPLLLQALSAAGLFLRVTSHTKNSVVRATTQAADALKAQGQTSESLAEFCHDSALQTIGPRGRRTR